MDNHHIRHIKRDEFLSNYNGKIIRETEVMNCGCFKKRNRQALINEKGIYSNYSSNIFGNNRFHFTFLLEFRLDLSSEILLKE